MTCYSLKFAQHLLSIVAPNAVSGPESAPTFPIFGVHKLKTRLRQERSDQDDISIRAG
jgi:hypothetical protein